MNPQRGTPIAAAIVTAVLACLPLLAVQQLGVIATGAAGLIYLSYWLTCVVVFVARRRGWPERTDVYFSLGRWGNVVNILAIVYGGAMLINFAWFRPATNPNLGVGFTSLAKVPILGGFPIFEFSVALLLLIGGIYWLTVQRHRTQTQQDLSGTDASVA